MSTTDRRHELTITVRTAREKGVEAVNDAGRQATGQLNLGDPLILATIDVFEDLLRRDQVTRSEELAVLGSYLYRALFSGEIEALFQDEIRIARAANRRLRLQLTFTAEQEELISLPWEFLYCQDAKSGDFLATRVDLVLARFFPIGQNRQSFMPESGPLKILVGVSRPEGLDTIVAQPVIDAIESLAQSGAGAEDRSAAPIVVSVLKQPNTDNFVKALAEFKPHIFHFIGHGRFANKKAQIAFTQVNSNQVFWCDDGQLVKCFQRTQVFPRLVFLQMCEGGETGVNRMALTSFTGFAPRLLSADIPAVIAMKYVIRNGDAIKFSQTFYQELAKGKPIDEAAQLGRDQIGFDHGYSNRVFGTPILFIHSYDGIIQPTAPTPADDAPKPSAPAAPVAAPAVQPATEPSTVLRAGPTPLSPNLTWGAATVAPGGGQSALTMRLGEQRGSTPAMPDAIAAVGDVVSAVMAAGERKIGQLPLTLAEKALLFNWLAALEPELRGQDKAAIQSLLLQRSQLAGSDLTLIQVLLAMTLAAQ